MDQQPLAGNLAKTALPQLLFRIWKLKRSGTLSLRRGTEERRLYFERGNLVLHPSTFPEKNFLEFLAAKRILTAVQKRECEKHGRTNSRSVVRSLAELGLLPPDRLWTLMEMFFKEHAFGLFDWPEGEYAFATGYIQEECAYLTGLHTLNFALQGIRRMANQDLLASLLPAEEETIQAYAPVYLDFMRLLPHEKYLLNLLAEARTLREVCALSELGEPATRKVLYAFVSLGLAGPSAQESAAKPTPDYSIMENEKILAAFKEKSACIFRYISKEIGPVAMTLVGKCLEEVNAWLGPNLPKIGLLDDGTFEVKSSLRANRDLFLRVIEEVLAAEVLMVKRTLGDGHEAALVKILERTGSLT